MTGFWLKIIALVTMIIDHTGLLMGNVLIMRAIGRIAFPIYAFLVAQGCHKTRNIKKYMLRLGIFALISEVPFDLVAGRALFVLSKQNIFWTLLLGVLTIFVLGRDIKTYIKYPLAAICIAAGDLLYTDYGTKGIVLILALYFLDTRALQLMVIAVFAAVTYIGLDIGMYMLFAGFTALTLPIIWLYNGERGYRDPHYLFYWAYPAHLLLGALLVRLL